MRGGRGTREYKGRGTRGEEGDIRGRGEGCRRRRKVCALGILIAIIT